MQHVIELTSKSREDPLGETEQLRSFVQDLAAAIVSPVNDLEGVWRITNRVYDRWVTGPWAYDKTTAPGKTSELQPKQDLGLSA
jgi:hypothetical protein